MQKKQGVSLIVLSVTILVMAILAATSMISLENTGMISRSKNTVNKQNQQEEYTRLQVIKNRMLADNFGEITVDEYITELKSSGIIEELVTTNEHFNKVVKTKSGLEVYIKQDGESNVEISFESILTGLGDLITSANYGDTVDYTVTVDGITYTDWQIYYHNSDYVYLIAAESVEEVSLDKGTTVTSLTTAEKALYEKFIVGNGPKYTLIDTSTDENNYTMYNSQAVAQLIKDYADFANTTTYGANVVGAIGGPTLQLLVAGWNAKHPTSSEFPMTLTIETYGYKINGGSYVRVTGDGLYVLSDHWYWLASPSAFGAAYVSGAGNDRVSMGSYDYMGEVRPVVCLKASIPAAEGTGLYDYRITK